jgi:hypothetical protein
MIFIEPNQNRELIKTIWVELDILPNDSIETLEEYGKRIGIIDETIYIITL